ncbi:unnamed protein product [Soboliphyme baturini]|uniref:PRELI/MSF1 domain-containing protein n=1 Tax=Soboliphyme baturini TaxID=241478 RepID=A0A183IV19_9BILA|nr:unnamed protein product [Soboliphyme baturini]
MKYYCTKSVFKNSWEEVATAFWHRYPNPFSRHVLSEDTLMRSVVGSVLYSKRLLLKTNRMPKWGERFCNIRHVPVLEESSVDNRLKTLVTYSRNISYTRMMCVEEKCVYRPDPNDANQTVLKREACISSHLRGFAVVVQRFAVERFKHNAANANRGINHVLSKMFPSRVYGRKSFGQTS